MKNRVTVASAAVLATFATLAIAQESEAPVEEIVVIGSRIPRLKQEGPAPITTIDARQIESEGLTNVPDLLKALAGNPGPYQVESP